MFIQHVDMVSSLCIQPKDTESKAVNLMNVLSNWNLSIVSAIDFIVNSVLVATASFKRNVLLFCIKHKY